VPGKCNGVANYPAYTSGCATGFIYNGIKSFELDYKLSKQSDAYGNQFRYRAKVWAGRGTKAGRWAWDVILLAQ
jgi:hypothetical protein